MKKATTGSYSFLAAMIFFVDRWTKHLVLYGWSGCKINDFLSVDLVFNRGMSFGLFHSQDLIIFTLVNLLIASVIGLLTWHAYTRLRAGKNIIGEVFIFTGAISNVLDRYLHGAVVDFISLSYHHWHFAIFNCADVFIFIGVILMLFLEYNDL